MNSLSSCDRNGKILALSASPTRYTIEAERARRNFALFVKDAWHVIEPSSPFVDGQHITAICKHLQAVSDGTIKRLLVNMPPRHAKCVAQGSMVLMADGTRKPIEDVRVGDFVLSSDGISVTKDKIVSTCISGVKPVLKITLNDGRVLRVTPEHRLYGWNEWIEAGELNVGDPLCVIEKSPNHDKRHATVQDAFLLALWLAEGTKSTGFTITSSMQEIRRRVRDIAKRRGWSWAKTGEYGITLSNGHKKSGNTPAMFLKEHGVHYLATDTIYVPESVFTAHNGVVAEFLSTYIACDGTINLQSRTVSITSVSERMVRDLQLLFTRFGIRSTVTFHPSKCNGKVFPAWLLQISAKEDIAVLASVLSIDGKQKKLEQLVANAPEKSAVRHLPPAWRNDLNWSVGWHRLRGLCIDKPGWTDRNKALRACQLEGNDDLAAKITSGLGWRKIISIEEDKEVATYDLETEKYHAFFVEGILSHNSTLISVMWPVWTWLNVPSTRFLCASYALSLAIRDNRKCRQLIQSQWFQSRYGDRFQLSGDQNVKGRFENTKMGYRLATSVGSAATGEGGDILLGDDFHSIDEKNSDVTREAALDWFQNVWSSRMNDAQKSAMVVVGQRVHEKDVSGYILDDSGEEWVHLNLASEYEPSDKCVTYLPGKTDTPFWEDWRKVEGELLWEERFPHDVIEKAKKRHGPLGFAALHQQRPVQAGGAVFKQKHERVFEENHDTYFLHTPRGMKSVRKSECDLFLSVDPAISEKETADYMVIQTWAQTPIKDLLLLDVRRDHWSHPEQQDEVEDAFNERYIDFVAVETVAYQAALFQDLLIKGIPCRAFTPKKDKVARASAAAIWHANGKVYFKKDAPWLVELQKELYKFPKYARDDQVDALSLASIVVRSHGPLSDAVDEDEEIPDPIEGPVVDDNIEYTRQITQEESRKQQAKDQIAVWQNDPFKFMDEHGWGGDD